MYFADKSVFACCDGENRVEQVVDDIPMRMHILTDVGSGAVMHARRLSLCVRSVHTVVCMRKGRRNRGVPSTFTIETRYQTIVTVPSVPLAPVAPPAPPGPFDDAVPTENDAPPPPPES